MIYVKIDLHVGPALRVRHGLLKYLAVIPGLIWMLPVFVLQSVTVAGRQQKSVSASMASP